MPPIVIHIPSVSGTLGDTGVYSHRTGAVAVELLQGDRHIAFVSAIFSLNHCFGFVQHSPKKHTAVVNTGAETAGREKDDVRRKKGMRSPPDVSDKKVFRVDISTAGVSFGMNTKQVMNT